MTTISTKELKMSRTFTTLIVLIGLTATIEACSPTPSSENPKMVRSTTTDKPKETSTTPLSRATDPSSEKPKETSTMPPSSERDASSDKPQETKTTQPWSEADSTPPESTAPPTSSTTEEKDTSSIEVLTRPTSPFRFRKRPAAVNSIKDNRQCSDQNGNCRENCEKSEFLKGRFSCPFPRNCCVPRP
ncbi:flocculation protein FLO11-like isoform X1 [Xenia sp. Carnegie-2017]|uniref:flocculation protein FLO11-like isoform X1 n=1 Tax=Xenia sp. Carnegie-2017 TaxID=2897299 RepID=UPI001F0365B0|nr:flocculation protein FLO11-like isoform X1 [Xenia sp. Carnegie-2017]